MQLYLQRINCWFFAPYPECYLSSIFSHGCCSRLLGLPCKSWRCIHSKVRNTIFSCHCLPSDFNIYQLSTFSGKLELSAKCFQELLLKDQNHPAALVNYAVLLLCRYGSLSAGTWMLACHNLLVLAIFLSYHKGMFFPMLFCSSQSSDTRQLDNTHLIVGCVTSIDLFVYVH